MLPPLAEIVAAVPVRANVWRTYRQVRRAFPALGRGMALLAAAHIQRQRLA